MADPVSSNVSFRKPGLAAAAVTLIAFGIFAVGRPYWTLESFWMVMVICAMAIGVSQPRLSGALLSAAPLLMAAVLYYAFPYQGIVALLLVIPAVLLLWSVRQVIRLRHRNWTAGLAGIAMLILIVVGYEWLDVTVILVGLLIGPVAIVTGARVLWRLWRGGRKNRVVSPVLLRIGTACLLVLATVTAIATGYGLANAPQTDAFTEFTGDIGTEPGTLLRTEPFTRGLPEESIGVRMLYTTTGIEGDIVLATGLVILPPNEPAEPLPVILWTHGTTGIDVRCAPTLLNDPLTAGAMFAPERILEQGWAIVAPDYLGLGAAAPHPYLVGAPSAHSSLDAVRAARQIDTASLSDQTVVWGHSQGGGAALWIGIEAPTYAPDVPLTGVVAMAPASNLTGLIDAVLSSPTGPIFGGYIIYGFASAYDDVDMDDTIRPAARIGQSKLVKRCLSEPSIVLSFASALMREPFIRGSLDSGALYNRLAENVPNAPIQAPLFIGQGEEDSLVRADAQAEYVQGLCESGQVVEYHTYPGLDHLPVVEKDSPLINDAVEWTTARLAGEPVPTACTLNGN